jgi:hypothetical protein
MPSTSLAVDGSARAFNCVEVIPSTGIIVGRGVGGSAVSLGRIVDVAGSVAVYTGGLGVAVMSLCAATPQPVNKKYMIVKVNTLRFIVT